MNGKTVLLLQQLFPVEAGSHVYNVGDDTTFVDALHLVAGKLAMEAVLDNRMITRRAGLLPVRYRLDGDDMQRIPDEQLA